MNTQALPETAANAKSSAGASGSVKPSRPRFKAWLFKPLVFLICLIPIVPAVLGVASGSGAYVDPIEGLLLHSGEWGLRFFLITLCVTPAQILLKSAAIGKLRRMLGLFTFFYATVHLAVWVVLDQGLNLSDALSAIVEKKFITVGIVVWLGLLALALTSNRFSVRKLGKKWKGLHNSVYILAVMAVVHYVWQVKASELWEPTVYLGVLAGLLVWRFARVVKR